MTRPKAVAASEAVCPEPPVLPRKIWEDGAMTVTQTARFLGCSRKHCFELMSRGELPWGRLGKTRRIPRKAALDLLAGEQSGQD